MTIPYAPPLGFAAADGSVISDAGPTTRTLYAGFWGQGVFRSKDSGAIEQFHPRVMHLQFDPHRGSGDQPHLYIGTQGRGLFRYLPPQ